MINTTNLSGEPGQAHSGDVWRTADGTWVDMVFWSPQWAEDQLDRVLVRHEASLGYTTAFWRSIANAKPLYERDGWHSQLQARAEVDYPDELVSAIVGLNLAWITNNPFSFRAQVEKAIDRRDAVSVNHRVAGWLASYFDVLVRAEPSAPPGRETPARLRRPRVRPCSLRVAQRCRGGGDGEGSAPSA